MTSDEKFGRMAMIGAIAAAAVVGGVLLALYPANYGSSGNTQTPQYSGGGQTYSSPTQTSTASQYASNTTSGSQNNTSTAPSQSGGTSASGPGY